MYLYEDQRILCKEKSYSGKKKRFTFNTEIITNSKGIIIHQTKSSLGSSHDFSIFKKESKSILNIIKLLTGSSKTKLYSDKGFLGISDYLDNNTQSMQPKKRSKNRQLTERERTKNSKINRVRTRVEHTIGDMKTYARMVDAYDGTLEEFETEFSVVTGLVNLRTMWKKIRLDGKRVNRHRHGLCILIRCMVKYHNATLCVFCQADYFACLIIYFVFFVKFG